MIKEGLDRLRWGWYSCLYERRVREKLTSRLEAVRMQFNSRAVGNRQQRRMNRKAVRPLTNTESLILAQDERWRRA